MDRLLGNYTAESRHFEGHAVFEVLEGMLNVKILGETVNLLQGDVVFIPAHTTYKYWRAVVYTKMLSINQGGKGLDTVLTKGATRWDSPVWPTYT
jgi:mannose-6-phosphate isomerase-like protein (cupin superfamily)